MNEKYNENKILLLSNNKEYIIVSNIIIDNTTYIYVINKDNLEEFKFLKLLENDRLVEIKDEVTIKQIVFAVYNKESNK